MTKKKKWILIAVIIVIVIASALFWFKRGDDTDALQKEIVTIGDLKRTVSVTGSLISESPVALNFENAGRIKTINVRVGDEIIEGDIIAILDNNVLSEQVKKAKAALDKALWDDKRNDDSTREALEKVDNAEDYLEAIDDYYGQLVDAAEVALANTSDYQEDAQSYYDQIVADSGASSAEAKAALLTLTTANNSEEAAEESLETAKKNKDLNIVSAENSLDVVEESLETTESDYAKSSRNATVIAAQADYQIALKALENASLKAPLNGLISKINYEEGEVLGSASLGNSFGEMITNDFILEAEIPESDISEIKLNQLAEVTFDAFEYDRKFTARVIEIEPASTEIQEVIYYKTKLKIAVFTSEERSPDLKFKEGMSADIDILVDSKEKSVRLLDQFIFEKDQKKIVTVMESGELIEKEVKVGLVSDEGYAEILSGLREGEEVYLKEE